MKLTISGTTYEVCVAGSDVPKDENWPEPVVSRRGRGRSYIWESLTEDQYRDIRSHLEQMYECAIGWDDDEARRDREAIARDLARNAIWQG